MSGRGNKLNNVMVIEGDVVGDEPYFEGICDCKSPILSNIGKNLFDANEFKRVFGSNVEIGLDGTIVSLGDVKSGNHNLSFDSPINIALKPNTKYTLCLFNLNTSGQIIRVEGCLSTCNSELSMSNVAINSVGYKVFTTNSQNYKDGVSFKVMTGATTGEKAQYQIMIVEGEVSHETYSPYKSNTTTFNQKDGKTIVLRSLPNGVCDTLNVETGEYVKRIGEVVLDGSTNLCGTQMGVDNHIVFYIVKDDFKGKGRLSVSSDNFPTYSVTTFDKRGMFGESNGERHIWFILPYNLLKTNDLQGALDWLRENPTTVQYELETPIIKTVDLSGYPFSYENGHVQLSSGSIEQSLTPKVEYSVVTNRNGQIRSNQKMVERHQKQLDRLQAMILTNLVNTQYEQTLTNLKYDLKNVREEVK